MKAVVARPLSLLPEPRMNVNENARTTPHNRMLMIERLRAGWSLSAVAAAQGVSIRTVRKWRDRFAGRPLQRSSSNRWPSQSRPI